MLWSNTEYLYLYKLKLRKKVESKDPWSKGMLVKVDYNWKDYIQYLSKNLDTYANQLYFNLHNLLTLNNRKTILDLSTSEFELLKDELFSNSTQLKNPLDTVNTFQKGNSSNNYGLLNRNIKHNQNFNFNSTINSLNVTGEDL